MYTHAAVFRLNAGSKPELAEHKNYTDSILGSVSSGIITLDLDGRVATMNPAAEMLSGLFAPDVTGRYCQEVFAHSPELSERLMDTLEQQSGTAYMSLTLRRPNGRTLPIEMSTAPLRGREGKDLGVVGVFRDVTVLRLNATAEGHSGSGPAFRRNTAERVYTIEAAHNPEVAGSNPAPATSRRPRRRGLRFEA